MREQEVELITSFLFFFLLLFSHVVQISGESPFTPKAYAIRYWNNKIYKVARPDFLLNKASPLSGPDSAHFAQLAAQNSLSTHLHSFCNSAHLFCFPDPSPNPSPNPGPNLKKSGFSTYSDRNFTNYGSGRAGGLDSFKGYSPSENLPVDSFRRYSRDSVGHSDEFTSYASDANVASQSFNTYGAGSTGGGTAFTSYTDNVNVPDLKFTSYSDESNGRVHSFKSYSTQANSGNHGFANYGKSGNGLANSFQEYGNGSNVVGSSFSSYSRDGNAGADNFTSYGFDSNVPDNRFSNYGDGDNAGVESFSSYRDQSNVGADVFKSYAKSSNNEKLKFNNYGESFNFGFDNFTGYGLDAKNQEIGFKGYGPGNNFNSYAKNGVSFKDYKNSTGESEIESQLSTMAKGKMVNRWIEPGKFFRENELKEGNVMPMPDIRDKMPPRSFLPRSILTKIPFSSSQITVLKSIFHGFDNSSMETILNAALHECERAPSPGETKRCVGSIEDMIDFAVSVLGRAAEPRTTRNVNGSKMDVLIGKVKGVNGGNVTHSVSCHQSLYPYLLYYCHSVPKVRVYEADILDPKTKAGINNGVAICHLDTSVWSPTHGAFLALGSGPGKIEVCHWIFENDLTWTIAD